MQPLADIRVLDFSTLLPGPLATLLLAEAGADVIKIERPGGDEMRDYAPRWGESGGAFAMLNRGKRSVIADLRDETHRHAVQELARSADVILEQFRPGTLSKYALAYEDVKIHNPRIIYCSITGYGQTGPDHRKAGHDINYLADTGVLSLSLGQPGYRVIPPVAIADIAGGSYPAVMNILMALRHRDINGMGVHLDIAMAENMFTMAYLPLAAGLLKGEWPENGSTLVTGASPRYSIYDTSDGKTIAVGALEDKFWNALMDALGVREDLRDDRRDPVATMREVARLFAQGSADHWDRVFSSTDCCCTIVRSLGTAVSEPQFAARQVFARKVRNESGAQLPALPVPIDPAFRPAAKEAIAAPSASRELAIGWRSAGG